MLTWVGHYKRWDLTQKQRIAQTEILLVNLVLLIWHGLVTVIVVVAVVELRAGLPVLLALVKSPHKLSLVVATLPSHVLARSHYLMAWQCHEDGDDGNAYRCCWWDDISPCIQGVLDRSRPAKVIKSLSQSITTSSSLSSPHHHRHPHHHKDDPHHYHDDDHHHQDKAAHHPGGNTELSSLVSLRLLLGLLTWFQLWSSWWWLWQ